jgi:hypothetical protein
MTFYQKSGQEPFVFIHREDLSKLPAAVKDHEVNLHGGFAIDQLSGGQIYYGMPGCGIMRVEPDLQKQDIISLPDDLTSLNFHGTKIGIFDGSRRLFLTANNDEMVVILTLDGEVDFILPRPIFDEYQPKPAVYKPTDSVLVGDQLYISDGYGSNFIVSADIKTRQWSHIFGGKTENPNEDGKFSTAHGINLNPVHGQLDIADRPNSRMQIHSLDGNFLSSHKLPSGAFLCGISYMEYRSKWYGVIACLRDPDENRPAPIYIIDAENYELLSTIRPKEELGVELAQHLHNVVLHMHDGQIYLICQAWDPGHYFILQKT